MIDVESGGEVRIVEHNDATRLPVEGGDIFPAEVIATGKAYVQVRYTDGPHKGRRDTFWRASGWRAWDGMFRWRLEVVPQVTPASRHTPPPPQEGTHP